jgi:hypothetical protein
MAVPPLGNMVPDTSSGAVVTSWRVGAAVVAPWP